MKKLKLTSKIKNRIESLVYALRNDPKLAFKILEWLILRKTLFQIMKYEPIFSMVLRRDVKLGSALFPLSGLSRLTSKENCLGYLFGIYEPWVARVIDKNLRERGGKGIYRCRC